MRLVYSFLKDLKLSFKSMYIYFEFVFALIIVAVLLFAVPENYKSTKTIHAFLNMGETTKNSMLDSFKESDDTFILHNSRDEVEKALNKNRSSVGMVVELKDNKAVYEYILQGYEDEKFKNILETSTLTEFISRSPEFIIKTKIETLEEDTQSLSDRINMLPVLLVINSGFMGLFIIAAYIFLDKEEGTIRAFAVTPAKVWEYLAGKVLVMLVTGLISGMIVLIMVAGNKVNYLHSIIILIVFNNFGSSLGFFF